MSSEQPNRLALDQWLAESVRFTGFTEVTGEPLTASSWWEDITQTRPDTRTVKPKDNVLIEEGAFQDGMLTLTVNPGRVDWRYHAAAIPPFPEGVPSVGDYVSVRSHLRELMNRWFESQDLPAFSRLAYGAVLYHQVTDRRAGYRQLIPYLTKSVTVDPEESTDLLYQINRRRELDVAGADRQINRLSKWAVARIATQGFVAQTTGTQVLPQRQSFAVRLALDVNTAPEQEAVFGREQCSEVFNQLVKLADEIASEGDIP